MTLFFYGAVELHDDEAAVIDFINNLATKLNWTMRFGDIDGKFSATDLFDCNPLSQYILFELQFSEHLDVYDRLYDDFGGEKLVSHYREIARKLNISDWDTIEFGQNPMVDTAYKASPFNLPVLAFMRHVLQQFCDRDVMFAFDQDFENRFECDDIINTPENLLIAAWMTIAFGYTWPNIVLRNKTSTTETTILRDVPDAVKQRLIETWDQDDISRVGYIELQHDWVFYQKSIELMAGGACLVIPKNDVGRFWLGSWAAADDVHGISYTYRVEILSCPNPNRYAARIMKEHLNITSVQGYLALKNAPTDMGELWVGYPLKLIRDLKPYQVEMVLTRPNNCGGYQSWEVE